LPNLQNASPQADPIVALRLTEKLKLKILQTTRLTYNNDTPDVEFSGAITGFSVSSLAPSAQTSQLQRLTITVNVTFKNNKNEKENWSQSFSRFADYSPNSNFEAVKEDLIKNINSQLVEDIFNRAFTNW
jgi:hypothetical protein